MADKSEPVPSPSTSGPVPTHSLWQRLAARAIWLLFGSVILLFKGTAKALPIVHQTMDQVAQATNSDATREAPLPRSYFRPSTFRLRLFDWQ